MKDYPPYSITDKLLDYISKIIKKLEKLII